MAKSRSKKSRSRRAPKPAAYRMVLAFEGWMDGGEVSTGTVQMLAEHTEAVDLADLSPDEFYIMGFPGNMEVSAAFRPHVKIVDGVVEHFELPYGRLYKSAEHRLLLFSAREPNITWQGMAEALLAIAVEQDVNEFYFVGSFAGSVPHTREPRLFCTVSDPDLRPAMTAAGFALSHYEGPASFATFMLTQVAILGYKMVNLVAEIPAYIEGRNERSIETVTRKLASILGLAMPMDDLRSTSDEWERKLNEAVLERKDLAKHIRKLEEDYDHEVFDQMGDLKDWLQQQGVRVD